MNIPELILITAICLLLAVLAVKQKLYIGTFILIIFYLIYVGHGIVITFQLKEEKEAITPEEIRELELDTAIVLEEIVSIDVDSTDIESLKVEQRQDVAESLLSIRQFLICKQVAKDRIPIERGVEFPGDVNMLSCFTAINNPGDSTIVTHIWYYEGRDVARIDMEIGTSPFWRTWSVKKIPPNSVGQWGVYVFDAEGIEIGKKDFFISKNRDEDSTQ